MADNKRDENERPDKGYNRGAPNTANKGKQNRSVGRDGGYEMGAGRSMRGNDYYRNASDDVSGYDRSFKDTPPGYGSTKYNERDLDRERSTYSNRDKRDENRKND